MKKIVGIASAIAGIAVIAGICYFVYKHFFCCQCECDGEECECDGETCETKAAPHSRGYFNLRRVKEAAEESEAVEAEN
ncbi:MAG: hypothetical protein ACFNTU_06870 [Catonella sp.]